MRRHSLLLAGFVTALLFAPARPKGESAAAIFDTTHICKAAIAAIMGRPPQSIVTRIQDEIVLLSYVRQDDGTLWSYRCRVEGSRVIWASEPGGRWRTHPADERISYRIIEGSEPGIEITESYGDGSATRRMFRAGELVTK